ncbi:hypothetical protein [Okibacterium endophyticum]
MRLWNVLAAELSKLRTLPVAVLAAVGTVLVGALIAVALAANAAERDVPASAAAVALEAVPFAQAGIILLGILPAAHEYPGGQIRTSLAAVPNRALLAGGKAIAALLAVTATAVATVGASLVAAMATQHLLHVSSDTGGWQPWTLAGAAVYLALIGMLTHAVAVLVRHLVPALVGMLAALLIVPPILGAVTEHARWLPDRAGGLLYLPDTDTVLTPWTGTLVLLAWIIVTAAAGIAAFVVRDA